MIKCVAGIVTYTYERTLGYHSENMAIFEHRHKAKQYLFIVNGFLVWCRYHLKRHFNVTSTFAFCIRQHSLHRKFGFFFSFSTSFVKKKFFNPQLFVECISVCSELWAIVKCCNMYIKHGFINKGLDHSHSLINTKIINFLARISGKNTIEHWEYWLSLRHNESTWLSATIITLHKILQKIYDWKWKIKT